MTNSSSSAAPAAPAPAPPAPPAPAPPAPAASALPCPCWGLNNPPDMKSLINLGVAVSNPARLSVLRSLGSAIVRQFDVIPTTMSLASIPMAARYCSKAACGWILPM